VKIVVAVMPSVPRSLPASAVGIAVRFNPISTLLSICLHIGKPLDLLAVSALAAKMKVIDVHVHSLGSETVDQIIRGMEEAGLDKVVVFSPYPAAVPTNRIFLRVRPGVVRHLEFTYRLSLEGHSVIFRVVWSRL